MRGLLHFTSIMGPLSSLFDMVTFGVLLFVFHAAPDEFRTAWFIESMVTQILVVFIIRTNGRPWSDWPSAPLAASSLAALAVALVIPFSPIGEWFGFVVPPASLLIAIAFIILAYLVAAELLKPFAIASAKRRKTGR